MSSLYLSGSRTKFNVFEQYFNELLKEKKIHTVQTGPFISISRDFGCKANIIAKKLSDELNKSSNEEWKWYNKEILLESAKALKLKPDKIKYVFMSQRKSILDEVVEALSTRYYKNDRKIRSTIVEVMQSIIKTGNVIIVGRGGVSFTDENPQSFHIKLTAPLNWRVDKIRKSYDLSIEHAMDYVLKVDEERKILIENFLGRKYDNAIFDVIFNRKSMNDGEIVQIILSLLKSRKYIK